MSRHGHLAFLLGARSWTLVMLCALACGSPPSAIDSAKCEQLQSEWVEVVASLSTACVSDAECVVVGRLETLSCDGSVGIHGWGTVVERDAYGASRAPALSDEFDGRCGGGVFDADIPAPGCVNQQCEVVGVRCCLCPIDAGPQPDGRTVDAL